MVIHLVTVSVNFCQVDRKNSYFGSQPVLLEGTVKGLEYQIVTFIYVVGNLKLLASTCNLQLYNSHNRDILMSKTKSLDF